MDATLNVRLCAVLKERGDKVLRENGVSTSAAVRAFWQELADDTRELPGFLQKATRKSAEQARKACALDALDGVAKGALSNLTDAQIEAIGMERYE